MLDFMLLMHDDAGPHDGTGWGPYLEKLRASDRFQGGSSIGGGECFNKLGKAGAISSRLVGYLKVRASSVQDARQFLDGNPVFEAGGTVEIRELPTD